MELAPFPQVMKREAQQGPVAAGKARSGPASRGTEPLVRSQEEAEAFGQRFWAQYERESQGKAPGDGELYFKPEKMYSLMRRGSDGSPAPVQLLRLSWLLKQARRGAVLPRRQELPEEAFLSEAEVRALPRGHAGYDGETCGYKGLCNPVYETLHPIICCCHCNMANCCRVELMTDENRADKPLRIISISHGWLTPEHPDPNGEQLARFAKQIERERQCCPGDCCDICLSSCLNALCFGLFVGYCVIPFNGQQCGETRNLLPSGEFGVFYECVLAALFSRHPRKQPLAAAAACLLRLSIRAASPASRRPRRLA